MTRERSVSHRSIDHACIPYMITHATALRIRSAKLYHQRKHSEKRELNHLRTNRVTLRHARYMHIEPRADNTIDTAYMVSHTHHYTAD
jgi:hypothetical protein